MSSKTDEIYFEVFLSIKNILMQRNIGYIFRQFHSDFEKSIINNFKKFFPQTDFIGCYFHFTKLLWEKLKKIGIKKKIFSFEL